MKDCPPARRPITIGVYSQPVTDVPGARIARLSGGVAGHNWLVLLSFPLSAAAAYWLARHLALWPAGATIAAIAYAFSPFHLAQAAYHPHVARQVDPIRVLDCTPLDPESESVQWLTGYRVTSLGGSLDDCTEPNLSQKLAATGYTHLLVRRQTASQQRVDSGQPLAGIVCNGSTGPMPPNSIAAFRNASGQSNPSTQ